MGSDSKEEIVKKSLSTFIRKHLGISVVSSIDGIVLNYLVGILEDLGESADGFDIESFTEMMEAYLPGFAHLDSIAVFEWVIGLAASLVESRDTSDITGKDFINFSHDNISHQSVSPKDSLSYNKPKKISKRMHCKKEVEHKDLQEEITVLQEMFPKVCKLEIEHCLSLSDNDVEAAAQFIIFREENGESISEEINGSKVKQIHGDEKKFKENILEKYGYIDSAEDTRTHRPVVPKSEPKKLVRYFDNKVVTTKGERFTEIKLEEGESVKKTYVNLKASRRYRFH